MIPRKMYNGLPESVILILDSFGCLLQFSLHVNTCYLDLEGADRTDQLSL